MITPMISVMMRRGMTHLDLFSGIGGFAYAADQVWDDVEHIFVEFDPFCQQVLKKHWPESEVHGDIRQFNSDSSSEGLERRTGSVKGRQDARPTSKVDLLTGGFPCQPFSNAGLRRGTADDRHLWPEMLRIIRLSKPQWVIAENVGGILSWNEGVVFEQVCTDLEAAGYTVQPFVIPAVAVNAPHRRDRVWFVAHTTQLDDRGNARELSQTNEQQAQERQEKRDAESSSSGKLNAKNTRRRDVSGQRSRRTDAGRSDRRSKKEWDQDWLEVATRLCSVDDGLPARMGNATISKSRHRKEQLKAYGNAIVPQVAVEIMRGMK